MEDWARDSSDEEPSLPPFHLNALTEALLADLDPTGTATQDAQAVHQRRHVERHGGKRSRGETAPRAAWDTRGKDTPLEAVGGDSVALGPGFAEMARPPRRPKKQVDFNLNKDGQDDWKRAESSHEADEARHEVADEERGVVDDLPEEVKSHQGVMDSICPVKELEHVRAETPEQPMRRVVISPRHAGRSRTTPHSPPSTQTHKAADVPRTGETASSSSQPQQQAAAKPPVKHRKITVNGVSYRILKKLGRGGSGRVYEVMAPSTQSLAFKAIPLAKLDDRARRQIQNEVALLQSLCATERVVHLYDWCVDEAKNAIHIIMELGQIDLETIIKDHVEREGHLDAVFAGHYWREMLRCVAALHRLDVVHADIKPANFVSVHGVLKIVDLGIAHSLPDDTVNIYLEHLSGTPNYMAPETFRVLASGNPHDDEGQSSRVVRFGKPSDVWSLGCVLHLMVYGRQPFAHIHGLRAKMLAITEAEADVELEWYGLGGVRVPEGLRRTLKACLAREPGKRPTAEGLLRGSADGLVRETGREEVGRVVVDVMGEMARREVRREVLEGWVAEAMDEVGLR